MRAGIYARYSSSRQREESIEDQLKICNAHAKREGDTVVGEYCDYALSGMTDARPDFQRMIRDAELGKLDVIIVYRLDRFARDRYDAAYYKRKLKECGVKVISATEYIPEGAEGIVMESLVEGMAEWYSVKLSQDVKRGLMGNAEKCKANGVHIFGYRVTPEGYYEPDPVTGPLVRKVFERYIGGESQRHIADWLNSEGVTTTSGKLWTNNKISWVIKNDKYTGLYHFSDYYQEDGMPALVEKEIWALANDRKVRRKAMSIDMLLAGTAYCGCGERMVGTAGTSRSGEVYRYYTCPGLLKKTCSTKRMPERELDDFVTQKTLEIISNEACVEEICNAMETYIEDGIDRKMIEGLRAKRNELNRRANNLKQTLELGGHDDELRDRMMELRREAAATERELREYESTANLPHREVMRYWLSYVHDQAVDDVDKAAKMVKIMVSKVIVAEDTIAIEYNYHMPDETRAQYKYSVRKATNWSG